MRLAARLIGIKAIPLVHQASGLVQDLSSCMIGSHFRSPKEFPGKLDWPRRLMTRHGVTSVIDGAANTVAIVEAADAVPWTKPEDLTYAVDRPLTGLREGDFLAVFLDASVRTLQRPADRNAFEALMKARITRNGGGGDNAEGENPPK
jgi:hypothetical protein